MTTNQPDWAEGRILTVDEAEELFAPPHQPRLLSLVWTSGCFDIIHPSHVHLIRQAARLGDILVVGLNSDESVKTLKGPDRPVNSQEDRALVLLGIKGVQYVIIFGEKRPTEAIRRIKPDVVVKGRGGGYVLEETPEYPFIIAYGGRMVQVPTFDHSTTAIIERAAQCVS